MTELKGTFACPICGQDTPHHHTSEEIEASQPTISGAIAHCRLQFKRLNTGDSTDHSKNMVANIYADMASRLERILAEPQAASERLKAALRKICERTSDPVARSIAGEALEIVDQEQLPSPLSHPHPPQKDRPIT